MRRVAATGKEVRAVVGRMRSGQSVVRRCVRKGTCAPRICCPSATDAEILVKRAVYAAFSFAIGTFRGQDYRMDLVRAPSCKRRGFGGRHTMASPLLRAVPGHLVYLGGATRSARAGLVRVWALTWLPGIRRHR